jgi:ABC-2 type transport system ATP-binding protein
MVKAFEFKNVVKNFPGFQLGPLDLHLEPGVVLGYIGPNGAGKTTTMHCLVGLLKTDAGEIDVFGQPTGPYNPSWKLDIGYVGDEHVFYERWNAEKNLKFMSKFYPHWSDKKAAELVKRFRLPMHKRAKDLSTGNRVKLSLISALAHSPRLLILDEPTSGLDPVVRSELLDELFDVLQDGERAIFYSTHILSDIDRLVDELAFLDEGRIFLRTAKENLLEKWRAISFTLEGSPPGSAPDASIEKSFRQEGKDCRLISFDHEKTVSHLKRLGAGHIHVNHMGITDIAVQVMKGGPDVAIG